MKRIRNVRAAGPPPNAMMTFDLSPRVNQAKVVSLRKLKPNERVEDREWLDGLLRIEIVPHGTRCSS